MHKENNKERQQDEELLGFRGSDSGLHITGPCNELVGHLLVQNIHKYMGMKLKLICCLCFDIKVVR